MADVTKTVEIIFGGRDDLSKTTDAVSRQFDDLGGKITDIASPLAGMADSVLKLDAVLAALAIGGLAYAVKTAGDFEASFDRIALRINASDSEIEKFKGDVLNYAAGSSRSMGDINAALAESIQRGLSYTDALGQLSIAEELAVATHSDLKSSTVLLSTVMNSYGASMSEAAHYGDIFTEGVKLGAGEIPQMADEMGKFTGIAHSMGIPIETIVAAIAALGSYGVDTTSAIGGLKFMLNNLLKPSSDAAKEAANLGIEFDAAAVKTKGLEVVMKQAYDATNGDAEAMKGLFGSVRGLNVAFDLAGDSQGHFKDALEATRNSTGVMNAEYKQFVNDFENVNNRLKNSFTATVADIGQRLLPEYANIADALAAVFRGVKVGLDAGTFDPLFADLGTYGEKITDMLILIAKNLPEAMKGIDFTELISSLAGLGGSLDEAFKNIFGTIDLTTPEGLHEVLQRIITGLAKLTEVTKGIVDGMQPLFKGIGEITSQFEKMDEPTANAIGKFLGFAESISLVAAHTSELTAILSILTGKALFDTSVAVVKLGADLVNVVPAIGSFIAKMGLFETGMAGGALALGLLVGSFLNENETVGKVSQSLYGLLDINNSFFGTQQYSQAQLDETNKKFDAAVALHKKLTAGTSDTTDATTKLNEKMAQNQAAWDGADVAAGKFAATVKATPTSVTTEGIFAPKLDPLATSETQWNLTQAFFLKDKNQIDLYTTLQNAEVLIAKDKLKEAFPPRWNMDIEVLADGTTIETTKDMIYKQFGDNSPGHESGDYLITNIGTRADEEKMAATKKALETAFPKEKPVEIQAKLDIEKIKADSDEIQKAIEWKAKLDIADVEANAKIIEAAFKSIDTTITSTGTTLSSELATFAGLQGKGGTSFVEQQIIDEARRRDAALDMQKDLVGAEVDNLRARTESLKKGDAIITINGAGLQPQLEAFMFAILAAVQVKANAEGQKFLVGI